MKIDRLISIIMVLLERKKISATKLAEMFEVTPRTIYRDIETISLAGIPVITYPGINGGIGIIDEYKIDKKLFTTSDITTLLMGLASIPSELSSKEIVNTLAKVKGLIPAEQISDIELKSNQITIDLTPWAGNKNLLPNLEEIKRALNEKKLISFNYSDQNGKKSIRKVEPYQLVLKGTNWYMQAYCTSRQDFRIFRLGRVSELEIMEETFILREFHPEALNIADWEEKKMIRIKLLIDKSLREKMLDICGDENVEFYRNNQFIAHFPFIEGDFGYNFLLSFGDKCECLGPENVRKEVIRRIKVLSAVYD
jgi:predicted DNA-binding transcriptional regulator YafY